MPRPTLTKDEVDKLRRKVESFLRQGFDLSEVALACKCPRTVAAEIRDKLRKEVRKRKEPMPVWLWEPSDPEVRKRREAMLQTAEEKKTARRQWAAAFSGKTLPPADFEPLEVSTLPPLPIEKKDLDDI